MAGFSPRKLSFSIIFLGLMTVLGSQAALDVHYYDRTCPEAEKIIRYTVLNASMHDAKVPARILRMFFHDSFIRGCDASVLLDSTPQNQAEKDGPPNISLRAFYVIDDAKTKLESACPKTVSCADIVAIAARDVVAMSGGPFWNVLKGRKDGRISKASETINLPAPTFNVSTLIQSFTKRGLGVKDLVALSGETLKKKCPKPNKNGNAGQFLDSTASTFDNNYYKQLLAGKGVFGSDQALYGDYRTKWIVESFANDQSLFFKEFATSMVKLGNVGVMENGEVRLNCRVVN
ncbi:hypothetical protein V6Z12_D12G297600 [Gossypium hirsutum]